MDHVAISATISTAVDAYQCRSRALSNTLVNKIVSIKHGVLLALTCLILSACFLKPHKIDIQQGNFLDHAVIAKLKPGMTRSQVRFLLGTPLITDPFHPERWDYVYYVDNEWQKLKDIRRLSLFFEGDKLKQREDQRARTRRGRETRRAVDALM